MKSDARGLCFGMAPLRMDVRLDWLIASSGIEQGDAFRRLNAIENQVGKGHPFSEPTERFCGGHASSAGSVE